MSVWRWTTRTGTGVVHRDIKPENILLDGDQAVVADFGIATATRGREDDERLTEAGLARRDAGLHEPGAGRRRRRRWTGGATSQPRLGAPRDARWRCCRSPEPTPQAVMAQQVLATLSPIGSRRAEIPEAIEKHLTKALAKEPTDRFATAAELSAALEGSVTPPPLPAAARSHRAAAPRAALAAAWVPSRRRPSSSPSVSSGRERDGRGAADRGAAVRQSGRGRGWLLRRRHHRGDHQPPRDDPHAWA